MKDWRRKVQILFVLERFKAVWKSSLSHLAHCLWRELRKRHACRKKRYLNLERHWTLGSVASTTQNTAVLRPLRLSTQAQHFHAKANQSCLPHNVPPTMRTKVIQPSQPAPVSANPATQKLFEGQEMLLCCVWQCCVRQCCVRVWRSRMWQCSLWIDCVRQCCVWQSCMWQSLCDRVVCDKVLHDNVVWERESCVWECCVWRGGRRRRQIPTIHESHHSQASQLSKPSQPSQHTSTTPIIWASQLFQLPRPSQSSIPNVATESIHGLQAKKSVQNKRLDEGACSHPPTMGSKALQLPIMP